MFELPFQGENTKKVNHFPKALPWAELSCPFGTQRKTYPKKGLLRKKSCILPFKKAGCRIAAGAVPCSDSGFLQPGHQKWLDQILRSDDVTPLSESFAGRVARKASRRMILRQQMAEFLTYASAFLGAILLLFVVLYFTSRESLSAWTAWITPVRESLAGGGVVLLFIFFADRVVLPWFFYVSRSGKSARQP